MLLHFCGNFNVVSFQMMAIGAEPHVNTCYKHFYYFVTEFHLINEKEFEPLKEMTRYSNDNNSSLLILKV